jgi:hypothetical protein
MPWPGAQKHDNPGKTGTNCSRDPDGSLVNFFAPVTQAAIDKFAR